MEPQAFNLEAMRSGYIMQQDSSIMKNLAFLGTIFVPTSTVGTIFGTQFFSSVTREDGTTYLNVNPKFWFLWAISLPVTLLLAVGWGVWFKYSQGVRKRNPNLGWDAEKGRRADE
jgi:hypothetical protein